MYGRNHLPRPPSAPSTGHYSLQPPTIAPFHNNNFFSRPRTTHFRDASLTNSSGRHPAIQNPRSVTFGGQVSFPPPPAPQPPRGGTDHKYYYSTRTERPTHWKDASLTNMSDRQHPGRSHPETFKNIPSALHPSTHQSFTLAPSRKKNNSFHTRNSANFASRYYLDISFTNNSERYHLATAQPAANEKIQSTSRPSTPHPFVSAPLRKKDNSFHTRNSANFAGRNYSDAPFTNISERHHLTTPHPATNEKIQSTSRSSTLQSFVLPPLRKKDNSLHTRNSANFAGRNHSDASFSNISERHHLATAQPAANEKIQSTSRSSTPHPFVSAPLRKKDNSSHTRNSANFAGRNHSDASVTNMSDRYHPATPQPPTNENIPSTSHSFTHQSFTSARQWKKDNSSQTRKLANFGGQKHSDCFTSVQQAGTIDSRCLLCPARARRKTFFVNGHGPFCGVHGTEYKHSSKNCHLSDFDGEGARGRWALNEEIFAHCKELQGHRGPEYFQKVLYLYSHLFVGQLEIKRRVAHVKRFFGGVFDDNHAYRCQKVSKMVPPVFCAQESGEFDNEESHYFLRIALACFLQHRRENLPPTFDKNDEPTKE